jgi:hypothetical protein
MFNDEVDILSFRLHYYKDFVSKFIISESNFGFDGKPKETLARRVLLDSKIPETQFEIVNYEPTLEILSNIEKDRWPFERLARQALFKEISKINRGGIVLLSDVDEIASKAQILENLDSSSIKSLVTPLFYRKANWLSTQGKRWSTVKIGPASDFDDLNEIRYRATPIYSEQPGAHFSYLATSPDDIMRKSQTSAHKEFELTESLASGLLKVCDQFAIDHLGRFERQGFGLLKIIPPENLNSVQKEFSKMYPEYFSFSPIKHSKFSRIFMSYKVTKWWNCRSTNLSSRVLFLEFLPMIMVQVLSNMVKYIKKCFLFLKTVTSRPYWPQEMR